MLHNSLSDKLKDLPIFVVDDESVNLTLIDRILSADGFTQLHTIQSPYEVIEQYQKVRPHLILLDINMPGLDGFDVLQQLQELELKTAKPLPPIVFLTAQNAHEFRVKAFESGVLDFISKPFNRIELLSRVKNLLALESAHQELAQRNITLEAAVELRTADLRKTQLEVVQRLGRAAEFRDNETGAHLSRMSNISALMAKKLGFSSQTTLNILNASPMHDVGKIAIPDRILLKPGKFEPDEWEIMKTHTTLGYEILKGNGSELLSLASEIALSHHEKWNGTGYPNALTGEEIPISCRIVAIADVFDALVSERPYKKAWSLNDAQEYINSESGKHFDPQMVVTFNDLYPQILEIRNRFNDEHTDCNAEAGLTPLPSDEAKAQVTEKHKTISD